MNPFNQRQSQQQGQGQGAEDRPQRAEPLVPLNIPNNDAPPRPPRQQPPSLHSSSSAYHNADMHDPYGGGSFAQYTTSPPLGAGGGPSNRPGLNQPTVSFQEPHRNAMSRAPDSQESVTKKGGGLMGERRGSAATGISDVPELSRSRSNAAAAAGASPNQRLLDPEAGFSGANPNFKRKKSLVRPDRERMDPSHRQWYYRNHAANMDAVDASGRQAGFSYMPSKTGHLPQHGAAPVGYDVNSFQGPGGGISGLSMGPSGPRTGLGQAPPQNIPPGGLSRPLPPQSGGPGGFGGGLGGAGGLRRGKSILGRDEDQVESSLNILKRGVSLRRSRSQSRKEVPRDLDDSSNYKSKIAPGPVGPWMMYCYILTICCPGPFLSVFGMKTPEQQRAWREKIGLVSIISLCMAFVGFITFGFTQAVCDTKQTRYYAGKIDSGSTVFHGYDYNFNSFFHPNVGPFGANTQYNHTNPAYSDPWLTGSKDASMLFQKIGDKCTNFLTLTTNGSQPDRYFTCTIFNQNGALYKTNNSWCHDSTVTADFLQPNYPLRKGQVSWDWQDVQDTSRNLAVWKGSVLDFSRIKYMLPNVTKPDLFTSLQNRDTQYAGKDVSAMVLRSKQDDVFDCLEQIVSVGYIDSMSIGCVASKVELYVSLVFIIGVVAIKFFMAVIFGWFLSWRLGNYKNETYEERMKRAAEIEQWTDDIYRPAPAGYRPNAKKHRTLLPTTSRFSTYNWADGNKSTAKAGQARTALSEKGTGTRSPSTQPGGALSVASPIGSPPGSPLLHGVRSSASLAQAGRDFQSYSHGSRRSSFSNDVNGVHSGIMGACPFPLHDVVPQPPPDYQPFNFPLAHSICLVTAYSESFEGLRTTLDSLATTDYPNSHKLLLVIADGIVKGAGSEMSTPDICLSMMKDFVVPPEEVEGNSYVAIADGFKRHNMAKIYAGFYEYDDETVERSKQQRVPMILVAKCGTPMEADSAKPGNRGKRDSQVLLMAFMQKVMFDERMTLFDYEFFNSIWRVTGISPDHYEIVLMVDADTKVFPDSLSRMVACMVEDPEIMGLCGETKIANKAETWVTMIQVFEYYISHHQTKAFEACFGGVTCLPGCFSAYRIKAPKGPNGYWVPILANPDIVEHYSENVVDTLHKKNLLLLGEDRYLTTLMLKTFPKRKMMFVPQAVCKTIVPDTFRILLSQRRRWINSTVHNLFELVLVNDLCGTFCFSMRFVVFMELVGTLVLPAAIAFTLYVIGIAIKGPTIPVLPLVLLGIILGLPGLLIVVTSRKVAYVGWMLIYLCSLPIWNFVFPSYAFWHMDDFSWGATRVIQGDKKGGNHGDAEGKFDPTNIVMKRWAEFERERRWKSGTHSRDSTYDVVQRTGSPERSGSTRYSVVSSDTYHSNPSSLPTDAANRLLSGLGLGDRASNGNSGTSGGHDTQDGSESGHIKQTSNSARARLDSVPLLELPAPLGPDAGGKPRVLAAGGVPGSVTVPRPRDMSPSTSQVNNFLQRTPAQAQGQQQQQQQPYESFALTGEDENRPMMGSPESLSTNGPMPARGMSSMSQSLYDPVRHGNVSSEQRYPGVVEAHFAQGFTAEPEEQENLPANAVGAASASSQQSHQHRSRPSRGFSLVDDGPVATPQGVRQVTRGARRMSSVNQGSQAPTSPSMASHASTAATNYASERSANSNRFPPRH